MNLLDRKTNFIGEPLRLERIIFRKEGKNIG
jgi:hypothetical protein